MGAMVFDRLRFVDRLTAGGIAEGQARAHADALDIALRETVATKADVAEAKAELQADIAEVKTDIARLEGKIETDIAEVKTDIARLEGKVETESAALRGEMRLVKWMLALAIVTAAVPLIRDVFDKMP